mmetsp:Transcript_45381/g.73008  ORF Transcript_45381/g.73008 Transcript_45381/m.73008 type:complete len:103 (+) Transcript_45381:1133-1441(+)
MRSVFHTRLFKYVYFWYDFVSPHHLSTRCTFQSLCFNPKQELDGIQQFLNLTTPLGAHSQLQKAHSGSLHSMVRDWEATRTRLMKETHWGSKIKEWEAAECG